MLNYKKMIKPFMALGLLVLVGASAPTSGDYSNAVNEVYPNTSTANFIGVINVALASFAKTNYPQFVNQGLVSAQVDIGKVFAEVENTTYSLSQQQKVVFVYKGTRENNNSPESIVFWSSALGSNGDKSLLLQTIINVDEAPSESNPYGVFNLSYVAYNDLNPSSGGSPFSFGYFRSEVNANNQIQLVLYYNTESFGEFKYVQVLTDSNDGYGQATLSTNIESTQNVVFSYSESKYFESIANLSVDCYDTSNGTNYVQKYGVYNNDGSLVNESGGNSLSIIYTKSEQSTDLAYYGSGLLSGIPTVYLFTASGIVESDFSVVNSTNYSNQVFNPVPEFNIPDRSLVTDQNGVNYWIRQLSTLFQMNNLKVSECISDPLIDNNINLAESIILPKSSGYNINGVTYNYSAPNIGPMPTGIPITVVDGVNQK